MAVIGAGPAGSAAALLLARAGLATVMLDSTNGETERIGESLPPVANRLLCDLGIWDAFCRQEHFPAQGTESVWADGERRTNDFFLSPHGSGWNLDRNRFDAMLIEKSAKAGTAVLHGARITSRSKGKKDRWSLSFTYRGEACSVDVRYLVDATGKTGTPALSHLSKRFVMDKLIAAAKVFRCDDMSRYTLVEAVDQGWFYSGCLPRGRMVVMYFTDADIYAHGNRCVSDYWCAQLAKAKHTRSRLLSGSVASRLKIVSAATSRKTEVQGEGWIAVGDAAHSFDPLSSLGIYKALDSSTRACGTILEVLTRRNSNSAYQSWSDETFRHYLRHRTDFYGMNRRFSDFTFWKRRREIAAFEGTSSLHGKSQCAGARLVPQSARGKTPDQRSLAQT